jgi:hypothetical protein
MIDWQPIYKEIKLKKEEARRRRAKGSEIEGAKLSK